MNDNEDTTAILAFIPFAVLGTLALLLWTPLTAVFGMPVALAAVIVLCAAASIATALLLSRSGDIKPGR